MNFFSTVRDAVNEVGIGSSLESLPPNRWDRVSINNRPGPTVTAHGVGLQNGTAWTFFTVKDVSTGQVQTIWAEEDAAGHATVSLAPGEHDDSNRGTPGVKSGISLHPIVQGFAIKLSVRLTYTDSTGTVMSYRFDGRSWP